MVLCSDNVRRNLRDGIFHCAENCANIDHRWVLESSDVKKPVAVFMQDKYSQIDTNDPTVGGPELERWYSNTLTSVRNYQAEYHVVLVFFTVRRVVQTDFKRMPQLIVIDRDGMETYLSPTFAQRGLLRVPDGNETSSSSMDVDP
ncbi:hypothetical protein B0O80DRAFT_520125 [Mortierella sp. GBAus27b]|nr:hypothetical protein B0O80DRAFT_520125 [Mortierella sp. GBAus27b]